ncbi:riboflavin biosynthesis protein RibF [Thermovibrio sp.]
MQKTCCTVGKFNAFHIGHQELINQAKKRCNRVLVISIRGIGKELFSKKEREEILRRLKVKVVELPFHEIKELSPEEFFHLLKEMGCQTVVVGKDWRFGKGRKGGVKEALEIGRRLGIEVVAVDTLKVKGVKVGTSLIETLLKEGKVEKANRLLGFPYFAIGKVVRGRGLGRKLGFPTLNVKTDKEIPLKEGVYLVKVKIDSKEFLGLSNYGRRPTFNGKEKLLEVFIPEKELPELYGREVKVEFLKFIRPERTFKTVEELKKQIKLDLQSFKSLTEEEVGREL